jgi:hypothetical protein
MSHFNHRPRINGQGTKEKEPKNLSDLFEDTLKDIYFAEKNDPSEDGKGCAVARS